MEDKKEDGNGILPAAWGHDHNVLWIHLTPSNISVLTHSQLTWLKATFVGIRRKLSEDQILICFTEPPYPFQPRLVEIKSFISLYFLAPHSTVKGENISLCSHPCFLDYSDFFK